MITYNEFKNRSRFLCVQFPENVPFTIDLSKQSVVEWKTDFGPVSLNIPACKYGVYSFRDENNVELYRYEGLYLPGIFNNDCALNDNVVIRVDDRGVIENWVDLDFVSFYQKGFEPTPVVPLEKISYVIDTVFNPLMYMLLVDLSIVLKDVYSKFYCYLKFYKSDDDNNCVGTMKFGSDENLTGGYKFCLDQIRQIRIHYYAKCPVNHLHNKPCIELMSIVRFQPDWFYFEATNRKFSYENLLTSSDLLQILQMFKLTLKDVLKYDKDYAFVSLKRG